MPGTQETLRKQQLLTLMVVDIPALLSVYKDPGALFLCVCVFTCPYILICTYACV